MGPVLDLFSPNKPWTNMKELEFNSGHKTKVIYLYEKTSKTFLKLNPIFHGGHHSLI